MCTTFSLDRNMVKAQGMHDTKLTRVGYTNYCVILNKLPLELCYGPSRVKLIGVCDSFLVVTSPPVDFTAYTANVQQR